ncbi:MAG: hypothetical protein IKA09_04710 [Lachnospiraceae bacterium]|nr:hypothetical protein [Lachnospiraceae bacterium]
MNYQEFINKMEEMIKSKLSEGEKVEATTVSKNNNTILHGLLFKNLNSNLCTVIYLELFYELYLEGISFECIADQLWEELQENHPKGNLDMSFFCDFEKVKEHIIYRLINYEMNKDRLRDTPHIRFFDLAIVFYYVLSTPELAEGIIMIQNHYLDMWNITASKLADIAKRNTPKLLPPMFCEIKDVLEPLPPYINFDFENATRFYVLCNEKKLHGAAVILYPEVLPSIAKKLQQDLYIIPSSIHECLIFGKQDAKDYTAEFLHNITKKINRSEIPADEILSDYPFFYDYKANTLTQLTSF